MKILLSKLSMGQLYTDNTDDNDNDNNDDANNNGNNTRQTNHDCIGSLACMPNEPKTKHSPNTQVLFGPCLATVELKEASSSFVMLFFDTEKSYI